MPIDRVFIRSPTKEDEEEFLNLRRGSLRHFRPWMSTDSPSPDDLYGPKTFSDYLKSDDNQRFCQMLVCSKETSRILGSFKLKNITRGNEQYAIISYWVGAEFARKGYMVEGMQLLVDFVFHELGLHRLEANISPKNVASLRVAERAGFQREGVSRGFAKINGLWEDHFRYALVCVD